jgi:hypothetical protein
VELVWWAFKSFLYKPLDHTFTITASLHRIDQIQIEQILVNFGAVLFRFRHGNKTVMYIYIKLAETTDGIL